MPACKPITLLKDGEQHTFESEKQARDAYKDLKLTDFQLQRIKGGGSFEGISVVSTEVASEGMVEGDAAAKSAEHEASTFLNTLRTESGEALGIIRKEDGFIDVTFLCQKAGNKKKTWSAWSQWHAKDIDATIAILQQDSLAPISHADVVQTNQGGLNQHTWVHPDIAIAVAMWISPEFGAAVRRLTRRYMEGKVTAAESKAAAAAVQAASVPVQPEPTLPAKRPASEIEDEVLSRQRISRQRCKDQFEMLQICLASTGSLLTGLETLAGNVPASQQLVQTIRGNTVIRMGAACENIQVAAIEGASDLPAPFASAPPASVAMQLNLRRSVTVQQVAASMHLTGKYQSAAFLSKVGMAISSSWEASGRMTLRLVVDSFGQESVVESCGREEVQPFIGNLADAMDTHRMKFSEAYRGAMEIASVPNVSRNSWLYPDSMVPVIREMLDAAVKEDRAQAHPPITNFFPKYAAV